MGKRIGKLLQLEEAINYIASEVSIKLGSVVVSLHDALHRISIKDIVAHIEFPFFDRSAVDGFAVRAEDTYGASEYNPIPLKVIGDVRLSAKNIAIKPGEAVRVFTGSPLPSGANAVIMFEDVIERNGTIYVLRSLSKYANVSIRGEDIQQGKIIISRGTVIEPKHIVALATLGFDKIEVFEKIRICIMCIGNELVEPGVTYIKDVIDKGLTYNSTGHLLFSFLRLWNFIEPIYMGIARDSYEEVTSIIRESVDKCHLVITTGGAGPSEHDITVEAVEKIGGRIIVRGIAIRPGRPTSAGVINGKPVFILSGFPVAALIGLKYFVLPSIERIIGIYIPRKIVIARLSKRIANVAGYTTFVRVKLFRCDDILCAEPIALTGSGTISTILDSDGIIIVPANIEGFDKDQFVEVELL